MNNYHYIIAGLPLLALGADNKGFAYKEVRESICSQLSEKDRSMVEWFEAGNCEDNMGYHFYKKVLSHPNRFLKLWYSLDLKIRNMKVEHFAKSKPEEEKKNIIEKFSIKIDAPFADDADDNAALMKIFDNRNILEKELELDRLKWRKIGEFTLYNYFDMDVILAFLAKATIVERWRILDPEKGKELFKQLVDEVRGTFKGLDFNTEN